MRKMIAFFLLANLLVATVALAEDVYVTHNGTKYHKEVCRWIKGRNPVVI